MGVTRQTLDFLNNSLRIYLPNYKSIVELGDQQFMCCSPFEEFSYTKPYYEKNGKFYTSIDINCKGGSLPLDLNKDINIGKFDVVTNIGTLEHVDNFYMGFKNMHNLCEIGGLMIHVSPKIGHWPNHGLNYIDCEFFERLNKLCGYELLINFSQLTAIGGLDSEQVYVVFRKLLESKFTLTEEKFYSCGVSNS